MKIEELVTKKRGNELMIQHENMRDWAMEIGVKYEHLIKYASAVDYDPNRKCRAIGKVGNGVSNNNDGFLQLKFGGDTQSMMRVTYWLFNNGGQRPYGGAVKPTCGNKWCQTPEHLEYGDHDKAFVTERRKKRTK